MPSYRKDQPNRYVARVQLENKVYWLGSYMTRTQAVEVEDEFKRELRQCQGEAYRMWRKHVSFLQSVARVKENANA